MPGAKPPLPLVSAQTSGKRYRFDRCRIEDVVIPALGRGVAPLAVQVVGDEERNVEEDLPVINADDDTADLKVEDIPY